MIKGKICNGAYVTAKYRRDYTITPEILFLAHSMVYQLYYHKFPLAFRMGSYQALLRPMAIAHLVEHLYDNSRLTHETYHRLQSTRLLIKQLVEFGVHSEQGKQVIEHINQAHRHVAADNDAYRYVLSCFFLEPFRWNHHHGKHPMQPHHKQTIIDFWCAIGEQMNIKSLPDNEHDWQQFQKEYEQQYMGTTPQGCALARKALVETPKLAFPIGIRNMIRQTLLATLDEEIRHTLKLKKAIPTAQLLLPILPYIGRLTQ